MDERGPGSRDNYGERCRTAGRKRKGDCWWGVSGTRWTTSTYDIASWGMEEVNLVGAGFLGRERVERLLER